jgi:hypothetical protein
MHDTIINLKYSFMVYWYYLKYYGDNDNNCIINIYYDYVFIHYILQTNLKIICVMTIKYF